MLAYRASLALRAASLDAVVMAVAFTVALLAAESCSIMLAYRAYLTLRVLALSAIVMANASAVALLAHAHYAVMLAYQAPLALLLPALNDISEFWDSSVGPVSSCTIDDSRSQPRLWGTFIHTGTTYYVACMQEYLHALANIMYTYSIDSHRFMSVTDLVCNLRT